MKQINSNRFSVNFFDNLLYESETKEQDNESIIDEAARYLFDEGDAEYLPDYEEFNGYTMEISKKLFKKAKERALNALEVLANHEYEDYDGGNGTLLELNDNHTINELEDNGKDIEEWYSIIDSKKAAFEAETGVELYFAGRSGRHVCVEPTYDNCLNFEHLQEIQERLEEEAVKEFNNINESDAILETQHKTQKAEYTLIPANESKIKELESGSAFTWEGLDTSPKSLNSAVEFFKENTPNIKLPVEFFTWKGSEMNRIYGLTGDNAYPDDLNFVSIALDNWDGMGALPMIKFQVGARWLDDIVDNNARRQGNLDESAVNEAIEKDGGPFPYLMKHGQGPGTLPKDVKVVKYGESDKDKDIVYLDKVLTAEEESKYDLKPMEKLEDCGKAIKEELDTWVDPRSKTKGWKVKVLDVIPDNYAGSTTAKVELFNPKGESQGEDTIYIHRQDVKIGEIYNAYIDGIMAMPRIYGVKDISLDEVPDMRKVTRDRYLESTLSEEKVMDDGTPSDIVADNIIHADSDPRFQSKEQVSDEQLASDLAYFALDTTDEDYWNELTDDEYYEKNKKDYLRQINDKKFIDGVLDLLKTRKNNLDGAEDEEYGSSNLDRLIAKFEKKANELGGE